MGHNFLRLIHLTGLYVYALLFYQVSFQGPTILFSFKVSTHNLLPYKHPQTIKRQIFNLVNTWEVLIAYAKRNYGTEKTPSPSETVIQLEAVAPHLVCLLVSFMKCLQSPYHWSTCWDKRLDQSTQLFSLV